MMIFCDSGDGDKKAEHASSLGLYGFAAALGQGWIGKYVRIINTKKFPDKQGFSSKAIRKNLS